MNFREHVTLYPFVGIFYTSTIHFLLQFLFEGIILKTRTSTILFLQFNHNEAPCLSYFLEAPTTFVPFLFSYALNKNIYILP
jgi:Na+/H+ antiporter NhaB